MTNDNISNIKEIKEYAEENNVPIMMEDGIDFLTTFIIKNKVNTVLEIGTGIAYSAIMMALANPSLKVVSVEKDELRYLEALKNIKKLNLEQRITLIFNDALEVIIEGKFDLIFIDASKSKNVEFFNKFKRHLNPSGYIVTDNINFHGYVEMEEENIKSKNLRSLVRKIKEYIAFLEENAEYNTKFYEIGDGIAVSTPV